MTELKRNTLRVVLSDACGATGKSTFLNQLHHDMEKSSLRLPAVGTEEERWQFTKEYYDLVFTVNISVTSGKPPAELIQDKDIAVFFMRAGEATHIAKTTELVAKFVDQFPKVPFLVIATYKGPLQENMMDLESELFTKYGGYTLSGMDTQEWAQQLFRKILHVVC